MQDTELFIQSGEIAGVFVGFGALIAIRSGTTMAVGEVNAIRWVMSAGMWVVVVALAPPFIASYGLGGHGLWLACSLLALGFLAVIVVVFARTPENRAELRARMVAAPRAARYLALWLVPAFWLPVIGVVLALALVVLGLFPDQEEALYLSAVGLGLLMSALGLFLGVFGPRLGPASDAELPVPGRPDA